MSDSNPIHFIGELERLLSSGIEHDDLVSKLVHIKENCSDEELQHFEAFMAEVSRSIPGNEGSMP